MQTRFITGTGPAGDAPSRLRNPAGLRALVGSATGGTAAFALFVRIAGAALAYVSQILFARWLGASEYGLFVIVVSVLAVLSAASNLGFSTAVVRFLPQYDGRDPARRAGLLRMAPAVALLGGIGLTLLGLGALVYAGDRLPNGLGLPLALGLLALPLLSLTDVGEGVSLASGWRTLALGPTFLWRPTLVLAALAAVVAAGFQPTAADAATAFVAAVYVAAAVLALLLGPRIAGQPTIRRYDLRGWFAVSVPILFVEGLAALIATVDVLLLARSVAPESVAVYYAAAKTLAPVAFLHFAARTANAAAFSTAFAAGDRHRLQVIARRAARWTFWPSLAAALLVLALSGPLLSLFGEGFAEGRMVLALLAVGALARAAIGPADTLLAMAGAQTLAAAILAAVLAVHVILNLLLVPRLGAEGAAAAAAAATIAESALLALAARRRLGVGLFPLPAAR